MLSALRSLYASLRRPKSRRPVSRLRGLEALEARAVPAISVLAPVGSSTLTINANTTGTNIVDVTRENNLILGPVLAVRNNGGQQVSFVRSARITSIVFNGSANGEVFRNRTNVASTLFGNGGNDTLIGGTSSDTISGGPGSDAIDGGDSVFVNVLTEGGGGIFTLADPAPGQPAATMSGQGNDLLLNIQTVRLGGSVGNDIFDVSRYSGRVDLNGGGGVGNDLFRLGSGPAVVDGGGNGTSGDIVIASGISSARFDGFNVLTNRGTYTLRNVENVTLNGTAGDDQFDLTGLTQTLTVSGLGGDDVIRGGSGTNFLDGNTGGNLILTSAGTDVIGPGNNLIDGLLDRRLTAAELSAAGGPLRVALREVGGQETLNIFGPSGAGFRIVGDWQRSAVGSAETFRLTGAATLKTALGDLPFFVPAFAPLTFQTSGDLFANFGTVTSVNFNSPPTLSTSDPQSPLRAFSEQFGLDLEIPAASWGLALGSQIPGGSEMPINPSVPYLFFTAQTGFSASFGGLTASTDGLGLTVVFDPADPSLFLRAAGFEVAVSAKGYIPFVPVQELPGDPVVFGNLAAAGGFDLGAIPVSIGGSFVFDFDANDDGFAVGVTPDLVQSLIDGQATVSDLVGAQLNDIAFGINGTAGIGYSKAGFDFSVDTAGASLAYTPGLVSFKAGALEPLAGTPLEFYKIGTATVEGTVTSDLDFDVTVRGGLGGLLGAFIPNEATLRLTNDGVFLSARSRDIIGVGSVLVEGSIVTGPGGAVLFDLTGNASAGLNLLNPITGNVLASTTLNGNAQLTNKFGGVRFTVGLNAGLLVDLPGVDFSGSLSGTLFISAVGGSVQFTASGSVSGSIDPVGLDPFGASASWVLSDNQISVRLPGFSFTARLNSAPAFVERSITEVAKVGGLVTLRGRITEVDPADRFVLEVNWGDGTTQTYRFPPGSDGRQVEVTHRYREPSPTGEPYRVTMTWRDPQGAGSSAELAVEVVRKFGQGQDLIRASDTAVRKAEKLGVAREVRVDFDGDGVADVLALRQRRHGAELYILSGQNGERLARVDLNAGPETVTLRGEDGRRVNIEVRRRREGSWEVISIHDAADGERIVQVAF